MSALRRAGRVKESGLGGENERLFGMKAAGYRVFTGGDFFKSAAKVDSDSATACDGPPRYGLGESVVDLECAGRVFKGPNRLPVAGREPVAGQGEQGAGCGVAQGQSIAGGQIAKGLCIDAAGSVDKSTERLEMTNKCARNGSGSSSRNRPSDRVGGGAQQHRGTRTEGAIEGKYRVSSEPGEESPGANAGKPSREAVGGLHGCKPKARHKEWMTGNAKDRTERTFSKLIPMANKGFNESRPGSAICAEFLPGRGQVALQHDGCAVVEGVRNRRFAMHPFEPVSG